MGKETTTVCGISLKYTCVLIGVWDSLGSFAFMLLCAIYANNPSELLTVVQDEKPDETVLQTIKIVLIVTSIICALHFLSAIAIIFGAETNQPKLLLPWIVFGYFLGVLYIIVTVVKLFAMFYTGFTSLQINIMTLGTILSFGIFIFKFIHVRKYFMHLKSLNF